MKMFNKKPQFHIEVGGFIIDLYLKEEDVEKSYAEVKTLSNIFSMRIDARTHPFGYLWAAASRGDNAQLHGYAVLIYRTAINLTKSQNFVDVLTKEINSIDNQLLMNATKTASEITESQNQADAKFMEDVAEYADAKTDKERKVIREQWKEETKQILTEDEGETERIQGD